MNSTKPKATSWPSGKGKTFLDLSGKTLSEYPDMYSVNIPACGTTLYLNLCLLFTLVMKLQYLALLITHNAKLCKDGSFCQTESLHFQGHFDTAAIKSQNLIFANTVKCNTMSHTVISHLILHTGSTARMAARHLSSILLLSKALPTTKSHSEVYHHLASFFPLLIFLLMPCAVSLPLS